MADRRFVAVLAAALVVVGACAGPSAAALSSAAGASPGRPRPFEPGRRRERQPGRLRRRRLVVRPPRRALGQVGRTRPGGGPHERGRDLHEGRRDVVGRAADVGHREPGLARRQGPDRRGPGRNGRQTGRRGCDQARRSGHRLRPPDRGPEDAVRLVRQRRGRADAGQGRPGGQAGGQLCVHQGRPRRRQRRLPAGGSGGDHRPGAEVRRASRTSARRTRTTGMRRLLARRWPRC